MNFKVFTESLSFQEIALRFLSGAGTTLLITLSSIIIGMLLGFGLYLLCSNKGKVVKIIMKVYKAILLDIPVAIMLMICYYFFFGARSGAGLIASIICFSLTFSATTYEVLNTSISAVEKGQFEACTALGYSKGKTFFKIILPQTFHTLIPTFKNEAVSHLKATAFVGYIAVEVYDLTHVSNAIMNGNVESLLTVFVTAAVYFVVTGIFVLVINNLNFVLNPRNRQRKKIMKGVVEHD